MNGSIHFEVFDQVSCPLGCRILFLLSCEIFILWLLFLHWVYKLQVFSLSCGLPFHFLIVFLKEMELLILNSKSLAHYLYPGLWHIWKYNFLNISRLLTFGHFPVLASQIQSFSGQILTYYFYMPCLSLSSSHLPLLFFLNFLLSTIFKTSISITRKKHR